ncbi:putative myosin heavy chain [Trypanosoma rangeli]|uniref:Putative myosin heavy chain n=1 Tax=Trypanosoma rangeli TaxID=5698 RepID=A0A3R7KLV0_TRYRA|nr:putative myosin heavy chain [Trypanosoma rangeli]RNF10030.1 putative myosin heavy chain [Trypanosoma rangeli]|eukprot:RNF10030.1 putative myosin heavy chain [Trypanosoma rangeli]
MRRGRSDGSVMYASSSSDDDSGRADANRNTVLRGSDSHAVLQSLSLGNDQPAGAASHFTNRPQGSVVSEAQENTPSTSASKASVAVQLQELSGYTDWSPGTQVLFLPNSAGYSKTASATEWELGRIVELLPMTTASGGTGYNRVDTGDRVVVVERVGRGRVLDGSRIQTTLACVRRYSYEGSPLDVDDLCTLPELSDAALLYSLQERYLAGLYYTFTDRVLLAVNPCRSTVYPPQAPHPKHIVGAMMEALCRPKSHLKTREDDGYETARESEVDATLKPCPVALVVTGDSGAGKTETAKLVLHHLLAQPPTGAEEIVSPHEASVSRDLLHVLDATSCLLESFGNALTPLNDNSSRFMKCVTMFFNPCTGEGVGAKVECFLLEVSRLVARLPGDSTFHIFNMLFDARHGLTPEERDRLDTWDPTLFRAMQSDVHEPSLGFPPYTLSQFRVALRVIGFSDNKVEMVLQVLCGILHLLNIEFTARDLFTPASVAPASMPALETASHLLGFSLTEAHHSLETLFTTVRLGNEIRKLHCRAAEVARDSTAKHLYESLFQYILRGINEALHPLTAEVEAGCAELTILDIFGFEFRDEKCGSNDLEQLLINYANEAVQRLYEETTFNILLTEARREGVSIELPPELQLDRGSTFELLVQCPHGVLDIINDDSLLAQRSQQEGGTNLAALLVSLQKRFPGLLRPHGSGPAKVSLQHFCATVVYDTSNMSAKNRISTVAEFICAATCNEFLQEICGVALASPAGQRRFFQNDDVERRLAPGSYATTLIGRFRSQMELLMTRLKTSKLFWIRCIKPNRHKSQQEFDGALVLSQLKCGAMLRSLMLFGKGFCHSLSYKSFTQKYLSLAVRGYCCDAFQQIGSGKILDATGLRGTKEKTASSLLPSKQTRLRNGVAFDAAVYDARFQEACVLATGFLSCCMDGALLLGSSKVFLRSSTLRALLALGSLAKREAVQRIGRVGRGFLERRSLVVAWRSYQKQRRVAVIRERMAAELPRRKTLEREREDLLLHSSEGRAEHLAFLSRQAMQSSKRVERHWKEAMHLLTSELTQAIGEMTMFDKTRLQKEEEIQQEMMMRESYRRRIQESMNRGKLGRKTAHRCLLEKQRQATSENAAARRSHAVIDAEREKVIREEIIRARQMQLRVEQEVLVEQQARALWCRERRETRNIRRHLDKQQQRIADRARLKEEVQQRCHVASRLCLRSRSFHSSEVPSLASCGRERDVTEEALEDYAALGLVKTPVSRESPAVSHASRSLPIQREAGSSTPGEDRNPEVEWIVQKDMMTFWESLYEGLNS